MTNYVASALKYVLGLAALGSLNWTTALYPASLVVSNIGFVALLWIRRRQLRKV